MTRHSPARRPWRASQSRRNLTRPVIRSWSTTAPPSAAPASSDTPDVVAALAVVGDVRLLLLEVADARGRVGQLLRELAGRRRVGRQPAQVVDGDAEGLGGSRQVGDRQVGAPVLDHRDQRARVAGAGGGLQLREPPQFPGLREALTDCRHPNRIAARVRRGRPKPRSVARRPMAGHRSEGDGRHDRRGGTDGNELTVIASDLYQDMTIAFPERYDCGSDAVCGSSDEPIAFRDPILVPTWSEDPPMLVGELTPRRPRGTTTRWSSW